MVIIGIDWAKNVMKSMISGAYYDVSSLRYPNSSDSKNIDDSTYEKDS